MITIKNTALDNLKLSSHIDVYYFISNRILVQSGVPKRGQKKYPANIHWLDVVSSQSDAIAFLNNGKISQKKFMWMAFERPFIFQHQDNALVVK